MGRFHSVIRGLATASALSLLGGACGESNTPIIFDSIPPVTVSPSTTATDVGTAVGEVPTAGVPTTGATSTVAVTSVTPETTRLPVSGSWTDATDGLAGLPSECGNLSLVSARPDRDMMIVSIAQQGLWSSVQSDSWSRLGAGPGSATITNRGASIVYDPANANTFWETGIYNGAGVYRTDDNGKTFQPLGTLTHTQALAVDFTDPLRKTMLATTHEQPTLRRSTDGGTTWSDLSAALPAGIGFVTGPVVVDNHTYLLGTSVGQQSGVFRTTNGGLSWTRVHDGGVLGIPVVTKTGAMFWVLEGGKGIITSTDAGVTWTLVNPTAVVSPAAGGLLELPDGRFAAVGGNIVVVSDDHGVSWHSVGPATPFTPTGIIYSAFRKAFYIWHYDCDLSTANPVKPNAIMRLDFDPATQ
jgi:hypothetical protein